MVSKATRVHKAVNKLTRVVQDKVLKVEPSRPATRESRVAKADAVIRTRVVHHVVVVQVMIRTGVEATANPLLLF